MEKDSDDYILQALYKHQKTLLQYKKDNPTLGFQSYGVVCPEAEQILIDLGYSAMIDMYQYIEADNSRQPPLVRALIALTGIHQDFPFSSEPTQKLVWMEHYENKILQAADAEITSVADIRKYDVLSVLHEEKLTSGALSADKATTASIVSAIHEIKQEYNLSTEDIKAIAEFVQYIRTVHTAE